MATSSADSWQETRDACTSLKMSRSTLWRLRATRVFRPGVHFRRKVPTSSTGPLVWNVDAVLATLDRHDSVGLPPVPAGRRAVAS